MRMLSLTLIFLGAFAAEASAQSLSVTIRGSQVGRVQLDVIPGAVVLLGDRTLSLQPGTYDLRARLGPSYGSFTIDAGLNVTATGALTATPTGPGAADIGFDLSQLATVTLKSSQVPFLNLVINPGASVTDRGIDRTISLPPGTYGVGLFLGPPASYGTFTIDTGLDVTATAALIATPTGPRTADIDFDQARLVRVDLKNSTLVNLDTVLAQGVGVAPRGQDRSYLLPPGGPFEVRLFNGPLASYGRFTLGPDLQSATTTGALTASSSGANQVTIDFDLNLTAEVSFDASAIDAVAGRPTWNMIIAPGGGFFLSAGTFALPPGSFELRAFLSPTSFGTFTVNPDLSVSVAGSLIAQQTSPRSTLVTFDPCQLNLVRVSPAAGEALLFRGTALTITAETLLPFPSGAHIAELRTAPAINAPFSVDPVNGLSATALPSAAEPRVTLGLEACAQNQPPNADAGDDQQLPAGPGCIAELTLDGSRSFDPDNDPITYQWTGPFGEATGPSPTVSLGLGVHAVTLTVTDDKGEAASDAVVITVFDASPPVLAGDFSPITAECAGPDGTPLPLPAITAIDDCDGAVAVSSDAPDRFPLGATTVTFTASDAAGNAVEQSLVVTIVDTRAPVISRARPSERCLNPGGKLIAVAIAVDAEDLCDGQSIVCEVVDLSFQDARGRRRGKAKGRPEPAITGDLSVALLPVPGRVYTIAVRCTDQSGNSAERAVKVRVRARRYWKNRKRRRRCRR